MKEQQDFSEYSPKKLRTLRNNLNNRIESFKTHGKSTAELQKSHILAGKSELECAALLKAVLAEMKRRSREEE